MSLFRSLLLWALMLAVPFQGYAAATMQFCAAGETSATAATFLEPALPHEHVKPKSHAHDGGHVDSASGIEATPHHHEGASLDTDSGHKCGTCGACHSVALIGDPPVVASPALPPAALAEPFSAVASLTPRVLDKPPRA
ncbi:hypothetical protein [Variovorax sp. PAMC 28711]|jgi:hypothetical protein|uniref:hypothetical protein n=1 Tax=Variovorax sp. PAMC 28711 TaxID=1795631 RepID=UPI0012E8B44B|nr:hypothetical protein [Variovorax sp. PAMC 28711]